MFLNANQYLFEMGDLCNDMFFIVRGTIDLFVEKEIETGGITSECIDVLGRGSMLGSNSIIARESWLYSAINNMTKSAKIIRIKKSVLEKMR